MKKGLLIFCFVIFFIACRENYKNDNANEILIDVDNVIEKLDISSLFEDTIDIIPLETSSNFLISDIQKIVSKNENIFISDRVNQVIYTFNNSGKYIRSIGKRGGGPDEYSELGDFILMGDSVLIQDKFLNKIIIYNNEGEYISTLKLLDLPYVEFTNIGSKLYFAISYERSELGFYNMITYDLNTDEYQPHLAYNKETPIAWGLTNYIYKNREKALFILPRDHNIYEITSNDISAKYHVRFSNNNMSPNSLKENGEKVLFESMEKGFITGLNQIVSSPDYLFLSFNEGSSPREVLFNIHEKESQVCNWFVMDSAGGLYTNKYITTDENEFIIIQDANMFITAWENIYTGGTFKDARVKERFKSLYTHLDEDSNPVIFKFRFK